MFAVQTTCALGVVRDFKELAKYNLRMLTNPELEKQPSKVQPSSKETNAKTEAVLPNQEDAPPISTIDAAEAEKPEVIRDSKTADNTVVDVKSTSQP
jgi:hypothetical protein